MPIVEYPISASKLEFICPDCKKGVLRRDQSEYVKFTYPLMYRHICTHCGREGNFGTAYPRLKVVSNNRERYFVLEDEVPTPTLQELNSHSPWPGQYERRNNDSGTFKMLK